MTIKKMFSYGSNLSARRLKMGHGIDPVGEGVVAELHGYQLSFNKKNSDGSGKANIELHKNGLVLGVVYPVTEELLLKLDIGEEGYDRRSVSVLIDGQSVDVETYIGQASSLDNTLIPYAWYMNHVIKGAEEYAFPKLYIDNIKMISTKKDPDISRREKHLSFYD